MAVGDNIRPNMEHQYRLDENYGLPSNNNVYNTRMKHAEDAMNPTQSMRNIENARGFSMAGMQYTGSVDNRCQQYDYQGPHRGGGKINARALDSCIRLIRDPNLPTAFRPVNAEKSLTHFVGRPMDNNMRPNGNQPNDINTKYIEHSMLSANNVMMLPDNMRNMDNLLDSHERTSRRDIELRTLRLEGNNPRQMDHSMKGSASNRLGRQASITQSMENMLLPPDNNKRRIDNVSHLDHMRPLEPKYRPAEATAQAMRNARDSEDGLMRGNPSHSLQMQNTMETAVEDARFV